MVEFDTSFVYVKHSVHIKRPIEAVSDALASGPEKWLPSFEGPGRAAVSVQVAGIGLQKKVSLEVGEPVITGAWTEVPITWQATFIRQLFPVMSGKIELAPVDDRVTRMTVCGMYQPPLGGLGKHLDDAFMHLVAEATVKDLAESIAKRLDSTVADALKVAGAGPSD